MDIEVPSRSVLEDWGKLLLRFAVGGLLLFHGMSKALNGVDWIAGPLSAVGLPAFFAYGTYVGEIVAPIAAIIGKFTRIAGLLIAFDLLMAIVLVRRSQAFSIKPQGGGLAVELELLFLFGGVAIFLLGSGRFALSRGKGSWD